MSTSGCITTYQHPDDGTWTVADDGTWVPGIYSSQEAAIYAVGVHPSLLAQITARSQLPLQLEDLQVAERGWKHPDGCLCRSDYCPDGKPGPVWFEDPKTKTMGCANPEDGPFTAMSMYLAQVAFHKARVPPKETT